MPWFKVKETMEYNAIGLWLKLLENVIVNAFVCPTSNYCETNWELIYF